MNETNNPALISVEDIHKKIEEGENLTIIDVRTEEEYNEGHIKDSALLTLDTLESKVEEVFPDKDAEMYVYCRSGGRSSMAQMTMERLGYTNTKNISGGILEWEEKGYNLES